MSTNRTIPCPRAIHPSTTRRPDRLDTPTAAQDVRLSVVVPSEDEIEFAAGTAVQEPSIVRAGRFSLYSVQSHSRGRHVVWGTGGAWRGLCEVARYRLVDGGWERQ